MPALIVDANGRSAFVDDDGFLDIVDDLGNFFDPNPTGPQFFIGNLTLRLRLHFSWLVGLLCLDALGSVLN